MSKSDFGLALGQQAHLYTIENDRLILKATDFGATIVSLIVKRATGNVDVVLGYDSAEQYAAGNCYFGATVGRVANRIGGARFSLCGSEYPLFINDNGCNCLHGGERGFSHRFFEAREEGESLVFSRISPDMEEGFPAKLALGVRFTLDGGSLAIKYTYCADGQTVVNLTNHSYFNLNGGGSILAHRLTLNAPLFCRVAATQTPDGRPEPVAGTAFDFTAEKRVGECLGSDEPQFSITKYYDHPYIFGVGDTKATLVGDKSGIEMTLSTDMPGVQLYSGNFAGQTVGKGGTIYPDYPGLCLETQFMPNGINAGIYESVAEAGKTYETNTVYSFK